MPKSRLSCLKQDSSLECEEPCMITLPSVQQLCAEMCGNKATRSGKGKRRKTCWITGYSIKNPKIKRKPSRMSCKLKKLKKKKSCIPSPSAETCELIDKLRKSLEDGVKETIEEVIGCHFKSILEKIDCICIKLSQNDLTSKPRNEKFPKNKSQVLEYFTENLIKLTETIRKIKTPKNVVSSDVCETFRELCEKCYACRKPRQCDPCEPFDPCGPYSISICSSSQTCVASIEQYSSCNLSISSTSFCLGLSCNSLSASEFGKKLQIDSSDNLCKTLSSVPCRPNYYPCKPCKNTNAYSPRDPCSPLNPCKSCEQCDPGDPGDLSAPFNISQQRENLNPSNPCALKTVSGDPCAPCKPSDLCNPCNTCNLCNICTSSSSCDKCKPLNACQSYDPRDRCYSCKPCDPCDPYDLCDPCTPCEPSVLCSSSDSSYLCQKSSCNFCTSSTSCTYYPCDISEAMNLCAQYNPCPHDLASTNSNQCKSECNLSNNLIESSCHSIGYIGTRESVEDCNQCDSSTTVSSSCDTPCVPDSKRDSFYLCKQCYHCMKSFKNSNLYGPCCSIKPCGPCDVCDSCGFCGSYKTRSLCASYKILGSPLNLSKQYEPCNSRDISDPCKSCHTSKSYKIPCSTCSSCDSLLISAIEETVSNDTSQNSSKSRSSECDTSKEYERNVESSEVSSSS